jgi:hypothetical protein
MFAEVKFVPSAPFDVIVCGAKGPCVPSTPWTTAKPSFPIVPVARTEVNDLPWSPNPCWSVNWLVGVGSHVCMSTVPPVVLVPYRLRAPAPNVTCVLCKANSGES